MTTYTAERTADINADADIVTALNIGDGVSVSTWSDVHAYTVVKKTPTTITLRADKVELLNRDELRFIPGGFAAHCENQEDQRYSYESNPDGHTIKISLRRWADEEGNERRKWKTVGTGTHELGGNAYAGRSAFRDYNF
jgi:hypothetical protein